MPTCCTLGDFLTEYHRAGLAQDLDAIEHQTWTALAPIAKVYHAVDRGLDAAEIIISTVGALTADQPIEAGVFALSTIELAEIVPLAQQMLDDPRFATIRQRLEALRADPLRPRAPRSFTAGPFTAADPLDAAMLMLRDVGWHVERAADFTAKHIGRPREEWPVEASPDSPVELWMRRVYVEFWPGQPWASAASESRTRLREALSTDRTLAERAALRVVVPNGWEPAEVELVQAFRALQAQGIEYATYEQIARHQNPAMDSGQLKAERKRLQRESERLRDLGALQRSPHTPWRLIEHRLLPQ